MSVASYFMYHWTSWRDEPMKAHCMGMEFPKRDTDSPNVRWEFPLGQGYYRWACACGNVSQMIEPPNWKRNYPFTDTCPKCADLDAVAEEQRVKEKTGANCSD